MLNQPADATTVNNTDGNTNNNTNNVINKDAPKVIAPIRLPGILSRGSNDAAVPEESPIENVAETVDDEGKSTKVTESTTETETVDEADADNVNDNEEGEEVEKKPETELSKPIKLLGKTFKTLEAAEIYANKQLAISRGAQSATAKENSQIKHRLEALEQAIANKDGKVAELNVDPNVEQFWNDVKQTEAYIETVKDPAEKSRLRVILTASIVKNEVEQAEARLQKMFEDKVGPIENERKAVVEQEEVKSKAKAAFATVADLVDEGTNLPSYPELQNQEDLGEIVSMWKQFKESGNVGDKILYHPDFVMMVTHAYRDLKKSNSVPAKTTSNSEIVKAPVKKKAAPGSHNLPPNFTKGNGGIGFTIPGVLGRR